MRKALITGISGQDGSHLTDLLLAKDYEIVGLVRPGQSSARRHPRLTILEGHLLDQAFLDRALEQIQPDEIYHLAAISFVPASWDDPLATAEFTALGPQRLLEAVRRHCPGARFFQPASAEMFGDPMEMPQRETTPSRPTSLYGLAKLYAHHAVGIYRQRFGLFACSGILFNHEGPRRGLQFVTRKVTHAAARIKLGLANDLPLGNLQARRDWGYAGDTVRAMWLMLQQQTPEDYVIGTGQSHSVEDLVHLAFSHLGLDWRSYVILDPQFYRPAETTYLLADPAKARAQLGWKPETTFEQLIPMMVDAEMASLTAQGQGLVAA